jgi:hypothetical protein
MVKFFFFKSLASRVLLIFGLLQTVSAIYPDDHWNYSTQLTFENYESHLQSEIDAGRTVMVRWIASPGWGWWRKQAPAWNDAARVLAGNPKVSFADVDMSSNNIGRGPPNNPGQGGWPTIRYFNKETGMDGASYEKKTEKSVCTELGPNEIYLMEYIHQAADMTSCATFGTGCDERLTDYVENMRQKPAGDWTEELDRLKALDETSMEENEQGWVEACRKIVAALISEQEGSEPEEIKSEL